MKWRSWRALLLLLALGVGASALALGLGQGTARSSPAQPLASARGVVAPGIVEGARPAVELRFVAAGQVAEVLVDEGARVKRGQLLAALDSRREVAQVAQAQARLDAARARLLLANRGPLAQELNIAQADLDASQHRFADKQRMLSIKQRLLESQALPEIEGRQAQVENDVAEAQLNAAASRLALLRAGPRAELRAEAAANVRVAEAELEYQQALLEDTRLYAPTDGFILRRFVEPGARAALDAPLPAFTIADRSKLFLRAEIDEADWGTVRVGQTGFATPVTGPNVKGTVRRLASEFGAKRVGIEDPHEPRDTRVLEVLFELDAGQDLPNGLRMDLHLPAR